MRAIASIYRVECEICNLLFSGVNVPIVLETAAAHEGILKKGTHAFCVGDRVDISETGETIYGVVVSCYFDQEHAPMYKIDLFSSDGGFLGNRIYGAEKIYQTKTTSGLTPIPQ